MRGIASYTAPLMSDTMPASEFGGKQQKNRVQPGITPNGDPGHTPTASEEMMLTYTTGDPSGLSDPDGGAAWNGLLPADEQAQKLIDQGLGDAMPPRYDVDY